MSVGLLVVGCSAAPAPREAPSARTRALSAGDERLGDENTRDERTPESTSPTPVNSDTGVLRITAIDSGQGDCTLIECPGGERILVDCGSSRAALSSREHVREVIAGLIGDAPVDTLVLTHPDRDHYNWLPAVLEGREVRRVVHGAPLSEYDQSDAASWLAANAEDRVRLGPNHHDPIDQPNQVIACGGLDVHVLAANVPPAGSHTSSSSWQSNTGSLVLRFGVPGAPRAMAILTGDATWYTERAIITAYADHPEFLRADVLRLGHHGTGVTSTEAAWLDAVQPRVAFSSAGHFGGNLRHPRCDVVDRALDAEVLSATQCHRVECGVVAGDSPTDVSRCTLSEDGRWCAFATEYALFDTYASGDLTFTFRDGWLEAPEATRGEGACE